MNNRRKFLLQTGMAATALVAAKPFTALAKFSSPLTWGSFNYNNITFLHTTGTGLAMASRVKKITNKNASIVLLHATNEEEGTTSLNYDASLRSINENQDGGYKIVYKDNIRVGIVTASANEQGTLNRINDLSAFLKKEKNCQLVVCISQLGFKNKVHLDDLTLAGRSEHLDIIVANHSAGSPKSPVITANKKKAEVIIQHTENGADALGKIKIGFNSLGNKYNVSF